MNQINLDNDGAMLTQSINLEENNNELLSEYYNYGIKEEHVVISDTLDVVKKINSNIKEFIKNATPEVNYGSQ